MSQKLTDSPAVAITAFLCISAFVIASFASLVKNTDSPADLYFYTFDKVRYCRQDLAQQGKDLRTIDTVCGKYPNVSDFIKTNPPIQK
jgi:hypothetical protein